ncbi:VPS45 [Scenedesmus sp. PABB004]|nr:VPS45 [Scenedesmus sp. PABB004]
MGSRAGAVALDKERSEALAGMHLTRIVRAYILAMVGEVPGYKALLLDRDTLRIVSTQFGRTELAEHSVVAIERMDAGETAQHLELKALVFVRPTRENVTALKRELRAPRFQSYHLYFTNLVSQMHLQDVAEADAVKEQVQQVQEFYADFIALAPHHFVVPVPANAVLINPRAAQALGASEFEAVDRLVAGLSALFLALRRRPVIRYQRGSEPARRVAEGLYGLTYRQQPAVFDFGSRAAPVVLLLDRCDDPVTPLLTQWTYEAMIHEAIGIRDGTAVLTSAKVPPDQREVVVDAASDEFYARHQYSNYGEVGLSVKAAVDAFASASAAHKQVSSLEDMRRFILEHSDFSRAQGAITKHVNIVTQLSEEVARRGLMDVSTLEQELANPAAALGAAAAYDEVAALIRNANTSHKDRARLVMLYSLRFESDAQRTQALLAGLADAGVRDAAPGLYAAAAAVLAYAGRERRAGDLWGGGNILLKAKNVFKGLQGVDNVYTQHVPLLADTLRLLAANDLSAAAYPYAAGTQDEALAWQSAYRARPPAEAIVVILGGSTYEEAKAVAEWNARGGGMRVLLGGSDVLNSEALLSALGAGSGGAGAGGGGPLR